VDIALLIARRIVTSLVTLLLVSAVIFAMVELLPGDAASRILGREATPETLQMLRERLNLDRPALARYGIWLGNVVQGELGNSLTSDRPIAEVLAPRIANTLRLSAFALLLYLPFTLIPAIIQALRRGRSIDHGLSVLNLLLLSIPDFLLAAIFLILFVVWIPIFPARSSISDGMAWLDLVRTLALPACTLAIAMAAYAVRMLRDNLIEVLESDYVRMAELKGLSRLQVLILHALPNALVPTLNVTALNLAYLIGSVVVVERLFAFPGFGSLLVDSLQLRDVPMIEAMVLIASAVYIVANLLADIGTILLNPKLRRA
jgi:peptide/nickel transport system permease protein